MTDPIDDEKNDDAITGFDDIESDSDVRIQQRAYEIWLEEGQPQGRALEHWLRAKREFGRGDDDLRLAAGEISSLSEPD